MRARRVRARRISRARDMTVVCGGTDSWPSFRIVPLSMLFFRFARAIPLLVVVAAFGCVAGESSAPSRHVAAALAPISDVTRTVAAGTTVPGGPAVKVTDAAGNAVSGATVAFTVTAGNGTVNPHLAVTDANGQATTAWTAGTITGANEVTASVEGVENVVKFSATGTAGSIATISL